jgi:hypothetical protein
MGYGIDRWMGPVEVTTSNNTLIFSEGASDYTLTLTPDTYYPYHGTDLDPAYPSLFNAIETAINASAASGTYTSRIARPSAWARNDIYAGVELVRSGSASFGWAFSDPAFDFPPEYLGYDPDQSTDKTVTGTVLTSDYAVARHWVSPTKADAKIPYARTRTSQSTDDYGRDDLYTMQWQSRRYTTFRYRDIFGWWLQKGRADVVSSVNVANTDGDPNGSFELIWEALRAFDDVLVLHDFGNADDSGQLGSAGSYPGQTEVVRLASRSHAESYDEVIQLSGRGGEFYNLEVPTVRRSGGDYDQ